MRIKAKDIMTKSVLSVHIATTLQELVELFIAKKVSGVPVIDDKNNLVGIISKTDLVTHGLEKELSTILREKIPRSAYMDLPDFNELLGDEAFHETVEDIMTTPAITVDPDTDISVVVKTMLENKIHRVVVTTDNKISGIIASMDLIKLIHEELLS